MTTPAKFHAYIKRSQSDWGADLKAATERAAKVEARKLFAAEYSDADIYLCEWFEGVKMPVASATVNGKWAAI